MAKPLTAVQPWVERVKREGKTDVVNRVTVLRKMLGCKQKKIVQAELVDICTVDLHIVIYCELNDMIDIYIYM